MSANTVDPDQMPHYVVGSELFVYDPFTGFPVIMG